jgi:hypothetical protein
MSIKEVVKDKYGQAAMRPEGGLSWLFGGV